MILLNFSHPIVDEQQARISELAGAPLEEIRTIAVQIDHTQALDPQVRALVDSIELTSREW